MESIPTSATDSLCGPVQVTYLSLVLISHCEIFKVQLLWEVLDMGAMQGISSLHGEEPCSMESPCIMAHGGNHKWVGHESNGKDGRPIIRPGSSCFLNLLGSYIKPFQSVSQSSLCREIRSLCAACERFPLHPYVSSLHPAWLSKLGAGCTTELIRFFHRKLRMLQKRRV